MKNTNMLLSDILYWIELLLDTLKAVPELDAVAEPPSSHDMLPKGWALKSSASRRCRFTYKQKNYLTEKFQQGEQSGQKSDPVLVARSMMSAMDSQGKRMFSSEEFGSDDGKIPLLTIPRVASRTWEFFYCM